MTGVELSFPKQDGNWWWAREVNSALEIVELTAGENLTAGNVAYIKKSDGKLYKSDTGTADDIRADGIVLATVLSGAAGKILKKGVYKSVGAYVAREVYYLGAAGAVSTTQSAVEVGVAESNDKLFVCIRQDDKAVIGTIKAYLANLAGMPANNVSAFWQICDGNAVADVESPLNGQNTPNLNGNNNILRGNTTSGGTGSEGYMPSHQHGISYDALANDRIETEPFDSWNDKYDDNTGAGTALTYYDVVYYIKKK